MKIFVETATPRENIPHSKDSVSGNSVEPDKQQTASQDDVSQFQQLMDDEPSSQHGMQNRADAPNDNQPQSNTIYNPRNSKDYESSAHIDTSNYAVTGNSASHDNVTISPQGNTRSDYTGGVSGRGNEKKYHNRQPDANNIRVPDNQSGYRSDGEKQQVDQARTPIANNEDLSSNDVGAQVDLPNSSIGNSPSTSADADAGDPDSRQSRSPQKNDSGDDTGVEPSLNLNTDPVTLGAVASGGTAGIYPSNVPQRMEGGRPSSSQELRIRGSGEQNIHPNIQANSDHELHNVLNQINNVGGGTILPTNQNKSSLDDLSEVSRNHKTDDKLTTDIEGKSDNIAPSSDLNLGVSQVRAPDGQQTSDNQMQFNGQSDKIAAINDLVDQITDLITVSDPNALESSVHFTVEKGALEKTEINIKRDSGSGELIITIKTPEGIQRSMLEGLQAQLSERLGEDASVIHDISESETAFDGQRDQDEDQQQQSSHETQELIEEDEET